MVKQNRLLKSFTTGVTLSVLELASYAVFLTGHSTSEMMALDAAEHNIIVSIDQNIDSDTLVKLCKIAYGGGGKIIIDNGVGSESGRFSLKLRAEKPNPNFDASQPENDTNNRRYLEITDPGLRGRGLMDTFYKEYSYWIRNARIAKIECQMELSTLLNIDLTIRQHIGDFRGFIKKMQVSVSAETGMGIVTVEMMYI